VSEERAQDLDPDAHNGDPRTGDLVGPYEVLGAIARGGMATVFAARDTRDGSEVALKLLLPMAGGEEARSRFRREFRALSRLHHPNVLQVHDSGLWGDRPWFSMERLQGRDLRDEVDRLRALPPADRHARIEDILVQVARALAYVHDHGLIHRDITPRNVWITPEGVVKVTDFGVVKEAGHDLTVVGEVVGTVAYMAPEQISAESVDARADLYSLGAVLYLMLTGRRPFSAHTLHGFMEKHLHEAPRPPVELDPTVPPRLSAICLRLLQKDPRHRYASSHHLLHVLGDARGEEEVDHWPPRTIGRTLLKARLRDALDLVASGQGGAALLLSGPSGYGKTRLLELAESWARRRGLTVARGRCRLQDRPFGAFTGIYRELAHDGAPPLLREVFGTTDDKVWERYQVVSAFRELVVQRAPCVILLDDLERADPATVELLQYLVRNTLELTREPVLFLLGHESPEASVRRQLEGAAGVETWDLGPLDAAEVEELVLAVLDSTPASLALAQRIHQETGGSPAFVADMLRGLVEDGLIVQQDARWVLTVGEGEITRSRLPMPASLRHALQDRLAPLSPIALETGRWIALSRRKIDLDVLVACVPHPEDVVMEALDELLDADIVEEHRVDDLEQVELSHGRFRDVLLEPLSPDERRDAHRRMGEALERQYRRRPGAVVEELAHHFEQAGLAVKAYAYLLLTATRHLHRSLFEESLVFLDRALAMEPTARPQMVLDDADRRLAEVHLARAQARFHLGQLDAALESTRVAEELAAAIGDARMRSRVAFELGVQLRNQGRLEQAERHLRESVEHAEEAGDHSLLPNPLYQLGGIAWGRGDIDAAERHWKRSLQLATRIGDERAQGYGYNGLAILSICRGRTMDARKHLETSADHFERLGMLGPLVIARVNLIELYFNTGLLRKSLELAERTLAQSREVHHLHGVALGLAWRAQILAALARRAEALADASEALRLVRRLAAREDEVLVLTIRARIHFGLHDFEAALATAEELLPLLEDYDHEGIAPQVVAWKARALAELGRVDEAERVLAERPARGAQWPHVAIRTDIAIGRALRVLKHPGPAREALQRALALAEANGFRWFQLLAHDVLASIVPDEEARERHRRVSRALARSLAANLPREDAERFLDQDWGNA